MERGSRERLEVLVRNGGEPSDFENCGQFGCDSDSVASLRQRIQDGLNAVWWDLQRLTAAENPKNRTAVEPVVRAIGSPRILVVPNSSEGISNRRD